ncbi:MAG: LolA family protein [Streptosporangiales bacterium]
MASRKTRSRLRWLLPAGITALAVGGAVGWPALSASAEPALPNVTAQTLVSRALSSGVDTFSGTVRNTSNLGLPPLPEQARGTEFASLLSGSTTLRVAESGDHKQRLAVLGSSGEKNIVRNGRDVWTYDSGEREAVHRTLPAKVDDHRTDAANQITPDKLAKQALRSLRDDTAITVGRAAEVAGRPAYQLVLHPNSDKSLVGSVSTYIDAKTWMPLGVQVLPRGSSDPAIDSRFTKLSYAKPDASTFEFTPPAGTDVKQEPVHAWKHPDHARHQQATGADHEFSWTKVVRVGDVSDAKGKHAGFVRQLRAMGTKVSGDFGSGTLIRSRLVTVLVLDDGPVYAGAVTPRAVEAAAADN